MVAGSIDLMSHNTYENRAIQNHNNGLEEKLRGILGKTNGDLLWIVGVGVGAWGIVFVAL